MSEGDVNRCQRCDMRAPAGKRYCAACERALCADADRAPAPQARTKAPQVAATVVAAITIATVAMAVRENRRSVPTVTLVDPPPAETPPPVQAQALQDPAASMRAAYEAQYATAKPTERENAVRACLLASDCQQAQLDGIIAAGAHEREREILRRLSHAWGTHVAAKRGTDGTERDSIAIAAATTHMQRCGISDLKKLDWTTQGEADKDIDGARGKMINAYGYVHQIRKEDELHWGTMTTSAGWIYFVVVGKTKGVVVGRYAEIAGMVVQRYLYENAAGRRTDSILIVGRVRGQSDSDPPLPDPPKPDGQRAAPRTAAAQATSGASQVRPSPTWDLHFPPPKEPPAATSQQTAPPPPEEAQPRDDGVLAHRPPPPQPAPEPAPVNPPAPPASAPAP